MSYFAPYIDTSGMHIPIYEDIRDDLIEKMKQIFGEEIYLDEDSMDYQMISIFAKKIFDTNCAAQLAYNNRTPNTAIGVGLDNAVAYANIQRKPATNSIVQLTLTGDAGTVINNGEASDGTNLWVLPSSVTIPDNGTITVEATSKEQGNIGAMPNTINIVATPVYGWLSVTNNYAAEPGNNVENDASLRGRYAISTRLPSQTVFDGMLAALEAVDEVTRVAGYENDTGSVSTGTVPAGLPAGLPAHSVTFVVEGGEESLIAATILNKKTPGCYTNGTTEVQIATVQGNINIIRFYKPTYNNIYVKVSVLKLAGYNSEYASKIQTAISEYILGMGLGENIYRSIIWSVATSAMETISNPAYSVQDVQFSTDGETYTQADVIQNFYNAANTTADMVDVEVS